MKFTPEYEANVKQLVAVASWLIHHADSCDCARRWDEDGGRPHTDRCALNTRPVKLQKYRILAKAVLDVMKPDAAAPKQREERSSEELRQIAVMVTESDGNLEAEAFECLTSHELAILYYYSVEGLSYAEAGRRLKGPVSGKPIARGYVKLLYLRALQRINRWTKRQEFIP